MRHVSIVIDFFLDSDHDWVNFCALDVDGAVWAYEHEPVFNEELGAWHVADTEHMSGFLGNVDPELVPEWFGDYFLEVGD